jgi:hypothetical protein
MKTLEELEALGEADLTIDVDALDKASTDVPWKISRWLKLLNEAKLQLLLDEKEYAKCYRDRYKLYKIGTTDQTLNATEITKIFLPADEALSEADNIRKYTEQKMRYIDGVVTALSKMTYTIKNAIEWAQFQHGR